MYRSKDGVVQIVMQRKGLVCQQPPSCHAPRPHAECGDWLYGSVGTLTSTSMLDGTDR